MERRSRDDLVFSLFRVIRLLLREKPYICRMNGKSRLFYPALLLLLVLLWAGNLAYGTVSIPLGEVIRILLGDSVEQTAWQHIVVHHKCLRPHFQKKNKCRQFEWFTISYL